MDNNIKIYDMTFVDLDSISSSLNSDFDDFWNIDTLKEELTNQNSKYIVAKKNDEVVGFGGIWKAVDDIHITNIVVRKDQRKKGIGEKILKKLIILSKLQNVENITLEVNITNIPAQNLYEKYGFKKIGIRKKYYNNQNDAFIMTLYFNNK